MLWMVSWLMRNQVRDDALREFSLRVIDGIAGLFQQRKNLTLVFYAYVETEFTWFLFGLFHFVPPMPCEVVN